MGMGMGIGSLKGSSIHYSISRANSLSSIKSYSFPYSSSHSSPHSSSHSSPHSSSYRSSYSSHYKNSMHYGSTSSFGYGYKNSIRTKPTHFNSPTMYPTEIIPPTIKAPKPTYTPTSSLNIPNIPLFFNLKHYGSGQVSDSSIVVLTKAISKVTGLSKSALTNMRFNMNDRFLSQAQERANSSFILTYSIITTSFNGLTEKETYDKIVDSLKKSVQTKKINIEISKVEKAMNVLNLSLKIFSVNASEYILLSLPITPTPPPTTIYMQNSFSNNVQNPKNETAILLGVTFAVIILFVGFFITKQKKNRLISNANENKVQMVDVIPNPIVSRPVSN